MYVTDDVKAKAEKRSRVCSARADTMWSGQAWPAPHMDDITNAIPVVTAKDEIG